MTGRKYFASLIVIIVTAAMWTAIPQAQTAARARLIHVASTTPAVDIYINGELAAADLSYGESSAHFRLPAGAAEFKVNIQGTHTQLFLQRFTFERDFTSIVMSSNARAPLAFISDDLRPLDFGMSRLLIVNALDDDASFNIASADDDRLPGEDIAPGASLGPIELAADQIEFSLLPQRGEGDAADANFNAILPAATSSLLVIYGNSDDPQLLQAMAAADAPGQSGRVRFVHAVQGAAPVDLKIDERLIVPSLAFAAPTEHIALPGGSRELTLSLGGTVLSSMKLDVSAGQMQTVVLMGTPAALKIHQYQDSPRDLSASTAVVNLVNAVPNSAVSRLRLGSGAIVAADVGFGEEGGAAQIVPGRHSMSLILDIGDERGAIEVPPAHYYAGSYYNLIALSGSAFSAPRLLIAETSLLRRVTAAPPDMPAAAAQETAMKAEEPGTDADTSQATAQTQAEPETQAAIDTEAEGEGDSPVDAQPATDSGAPGETDAPGEQGPSLVMGPYALVDLDPSARLQMRQYPSSDAMSLGLLPRESELIVLGRRGLTVFYPGETPDLPLDLSDFTTDPAAALYPAQDLQRADTWLFVMYQTDDGGALLGWANALYLRVYDETGGQQRLASLPTIRQNRAGSTFNTEAQPPDLADFVTARVHRLNPDALLNMRAANDPDSEVMLQLAPNADLILLGLDEADAWAFVDYAAKTGEIFRGWVSADYVQLLLNGEAVTPNALRALNETMAPKIGSGIRGSIRQLEVDGPTPIPPSDEIMQGIVAEIALDPGGMLHLRRRPDIHAESLALIPAGTRLSISGVTENTAWVKASYDEQDGWIFAHYVALLLRGRLYDRSYVVSLLPAHDNAGNPTG